MKKRASMCDYLKIRFRKKKISTQVYATASEICKASQCTVNIKHNGMITLADVLRGEAVFAYETAESISTGTNPATQKFDFIQELLNQVVPRKRKFKDSSGNWMVQNNYVLIDEDGIFGANTQAALETVRKNFDMGNTFYSNTSNTDASTTFKKLMKDYNKKEADIASYLHQIIDKETLVGKVERIAGPSAETIDDANTDVLLNNAPSNTRKDTGLYEIYKNVVERFNNKMIQEAELYRNSSGSGANTLWKPRTYNVADPTKGDPEQTESESYCYGCKNSYSDFWNSVTKCATPEINHVPITYAGDVNDSDCGLTGSKKYTGLKDSEQGTASQYYAFDYWTGIDCAGFVQRIAMSAKSLSIPGVKCEIKDLTDTDNNPRNHLDDGGILADQFITTSRSFSISTDDVDKIKRGDVIQYVGKGVRHVIIVYTPRSVCDENGANCTYEIVHAYGGNKYQPLDENGKPIGKPIFSRKVIKTMQNIGVNPTRFGRIKLWD